MILKCKMCGDDISINNEQTYGTCESCGTTSTLPKVDTDQLANLYNRANHIRRQNDFDGAIKIYEKIIETDNTQAEAHWCAVLCRYGIEYVTDPVSKERVPTCNRASFDDILQDIDYIETLKHTTDSYTKDLYEKEAKYISNVQKEIIAISQKEDPYDIFICYKESDENGQRTQDSALAQDIYYQLTNQGFKVFFSRISLEKHVGKAYEPYIFSALNTAKTMLVIGTNKDYVNATWVKNEWSRYLSLMKKDSGRLLIPCYKDMDAYDLPEELSMLQAQDMGKIGFIQDLLHGINKLSKSEEVVQETIVKQVSVSSNGNIETLLKRANIFLSDRLFDEATNYFNKALDVDPECSAAYIGLFCAEKKINDITRFFILETSYSPKAEIHKMKLNLNYKNAKKFSNDKKYFEDLEKSFVDKRMMKYYDEFMSKKEKADSFESLNTVSQNFAEMGDYKDAKKQAKECQILALDCVYNIAMSLKNESKTKEDYELAIKQFKEIEDHKDSKEKIDECQTLALDCVYNIAMSLKNESKTKEDYEKAKAKFEEILEHKDSKTQVEECDFLSKEVIYNEAIKYKNNTDDPALGLLRARAKFERIIEFKDAETQIKLIEDEIKDIDHAQKKKNQINGIILLLLILAISLGSFTYYKVDMNKKEETYLSAMVHIETGDVRGAIIELSGIRGYRDSDEILSSFNIYDSVKSTKHEVTLNKDGTVRATGSNEYGQCNVENWTDIISIDGNYNHTVGLKSDGTVSATGSNEYGQYDVQDWTDIICVDVGYRHTVGLKFDGTVVAVGSNIYGQCNVEDWTDIVSISASSTYTQGTKSDGTVVSTKD